MDPITLILTIVGIIIALVFGYLQVIVPFTKKEVKFTKKFPFVVSTTDAAIAKVDAKAYAKVIEEQFQLPAERRPIAVIPFKNLTGDKSFDYLSEAIPNLLITNLEQSKYLSVMTWERMHDLLGVLGKEDVQVIDDRLGFELCKLDGINNIVLGSFTRAGNMFATDLKVLEVSSKHLLRTANSKGEGIDSILRTQIDELSMHIAHGVGLSDSKIDRSNMRIADVTTNSMEAYNYFLRGREQYEKVYYEDARRYLEKAIEIDPSFASAYYYLARSCFLLNDLKASKEAFEKAKAFSGRVTEKERLYIEGNYASDIQQDPEEYYRVLRQLEKKYPKEKRVQVCLGMYYATKGLFHRAIEPFTKVLELDPNHGSSLNALGYIHVTMNDYAKAMEYFKQYAAVAPDDANPFDSMGDLNFRLGQLDEARAQYRKAISAKPDFVSSLKIAYIHALYEDYADAIDWIDRYITDSSSAGMTAIGYWCKAFHTYLLGDLDETLHILDTAEGLVEPMQWRFGKALINWIRAHVYYDMKEFDLSRNHLKNCYAYLPDTPYNTVECNLSLGMIELNQKKIDSARTLLAAIEPSLPDIDAEHKDHALLCHDLLHAEILLAQDSPYKAITVLEKMPQLKVDVWMRMPAIDRTSANLNILFNTSVLARAHYKNGATDKAILEYERLIAPDPATRGRCLIRPIWHYELAKLYEEKGLQIQAAQQYKKFLEIWQNVDADRDEKTDAQKRLARLEAAN